jgi:5-methylcytosine-specific restriction protein B
MNYWHMQLHPSEYEDWSVDDIKTILTHKLIGCSGDPVSLFYKIMIGDLVLVRHGGKILSLVKVTGKVRAFQENEKTEFLWFDYCAPIEILSNYSDKTVSGEGWYLPKTLMSIENKIAVNYISRLHQQYLIMNNQQKMDQAINLLKYKKQIILQGPPGTGKTKLAKEIAAKLLTRKITKTPLDEIKDFLKDHQVTEEVQSWRTRREDERNEFLSKFPLYQLLHLNLDTYCIGKSNKDNFCWWIERGLESYGRYTPGFSINYGVYYSKKEQAYKTLKRYESPEDAINEMKLFVSQVANEEFDSDGFKKLGDGFILKILASYYPDKYVQVYKPEILRQIAKLLKLESDSKYLQLSCELKTRMDELITETSSSCDSRELIHYLFMKFVGGNETEIHEDELTITSKPTLIQFHPSFSYEDFVRGIVAEEVEGQIKYSVQNKTLAELAKKASSDIDNPYVLIIDEINRANLSSVLGELIYALEYRGEPVSSMYALEDSSEDEYEIILPANLYIIGTMNTADRSVGTIDYAIRRRFAFVDVFPKNLKDELGDNYKFDLFAEVSKLFIKDYSLQIDYSEKNIKKLRSVHLSEEFKPEDVWLGHSYFIQHYEKDQNGENILDKPIDFKFRLDYEIKPILHEYVKDGILKESALEEIDKLSC